MNKLFDEEELSVFDMYLYENRKIGSRKESRLDWILIEWI